MSYLFRPIVMTHFSIYTKKTAGLKTYISMNTTTPSYVLSSSFSQLMHKQGHILIFGVYLE
jgi:hypothetical protein